MRSHCCAPERRRSVSRLSSSPCVVGGVGSESRVIYLLRSHLCCCLRLLSLCWSCCACVLAGHGETLQAVEPRYIYENTMSLAMVGLEEACRAHWHRKWPCPKHRAEGTLLRASRQRWMCISSTSTESSPQPRCCSTCVLSRM